MLKKCIILIIGLILISSLAQNIVRAEILSNEELALSLINETNKIRLDKNLSILTRNAKLDSAAQLKAEDMIVNGYFTHISSNGTTPWFWFDKVEYNYRYAGENLAVNFINSKNIINSWMKSTSHRSNILYKNFTEIGIGVAKGQYKGKETIFIVQLFGKGLK